MKNEIVIPIPKKEQLGNGNIIFDSRPNVTYVLWEYEKTYHPEKKYNTKKRYTIGKLKDENHLIPNDNFKELFPDLLPVEKRKNNVLHFGMYLLIQALCKKLNIKEYLSKTFSPSDVEFILDFASYSIVTASNVSVAYPAYAAEHALFENNLKIKSDSSISRFFEDMDEEHKVEFLKNWNLDRNIKEEAYIYYDSSNYKCQAGDIDIVEVGKLKTGSFGTMYNKAIGYNSTENRIVFYEDYNGSVVDVSQLKHFIDKLTSIGYNKFTTILDRGYFSKSNLEYLDKKDIDFIIMMKGKKPFVKSLVKEHGESIKTSGECVISDYNVQGATIKQKLYENDSTDRYIHLYFSPEIYNEDFTKIMETINEYKSLLKSKINTTYTPDEEITEYIQCNFDKKGLLKSFELKKNVLTEELSYLGFFAIVTSREMTAEEAITRYKKRDSSENIFFFDKTGLGNSCTRTHSNNSTKSKSFVEFIALLFRHEIYTLLQHEKQEKGLKFNYLNVPGTIREINSIKVELWKNKQYNLSQALTRTQKNILNAFSITEEDVKAAVKEFNERVFNQDK